MSAYICPAKQIGALAKELVAFEHGGNAPQLAQELALLNIASVQYRYHHYTPEAAVQDFLGEDLETYLGACREEAGGEFKPLSQAKLWATTGNYTYQSCESDECIESPLYKRVEALEESAGAYCKENRLEREGWGW